MKPKPYQKRQPKRPADPTQMLPMPEDVGRGIIGYAGEEAGGGAEEPGISYAQKPKNEDALEPLRMMLLERILTRPPAPQMPAGTANMAGVAPPMAQPGGLMGHNAESMDDPEGVDPMMEPFTLNPGYGGEVIGYQGDRPDFQQAGGEAGGEGGGFEGPGGGGGGGGRNPVMLPRGGFYGQYGGGPDPAQGGDPNAGGGFGPGAWQPPPQGPLNVGGPMYPWLMPYQGPRTAPMSPWQMGAMGGLAGSIGQPAPQSNWQPGGWSAQASPWLNDAQTGAQALKDIQDEQAHRAIASSMAAGGNALSGARAGADQRYQNASNAQFLNDISRMRTQDWQLGQQLGESYAGQSLYPGAMTGMGNAQLANAGQNRQMQGYEALFGMGSVPQQLQQHDLNAQYQDWLRQIGAYQGAFNQPMNIANQLLHAPNPGQNLNQYGGSQFSNLLQTLLPLLMGGRGGGSRGGGAGGGPGGGTGGGSGRGFLGDLWDSLFGGNDPNQDPNYDPTADPSSPYYTGSDPNAAYPYENPYGGGGYGDPSGGYGNPFGGEGDGGDTGGYPYDDGGGD